MSDIDVPHVRLAKTLIKAADSAHPRCPYNMLARALNLTDAENCILARKVRLVVRLFLLEIAALSTGLYSSPQNF